MNNDLKIIKKKYGEKMMHFCRENFSTILEREGLLTQIFSNYFNENKSLYEDLKENNWLFQFKNFIFKKSSGGEISPCCETDQIILLPLQENFLLYHEYMFLCLAHYDD